MKLRLAYFVRGLHPYEAGAAAGLGNSEVAKGRDMVPLIPMTSGEVLDESTFGVDWAQAMLLLKFA